MGHPSTFQCNRLGLPFPDGAHFLLRSSSEQPPEDGVKSFVHRVECGLVV